MTGTSFRFALTPVLQMRDRAVEAAQDALGRAVRARRAAEVALAAAEAPDAAADAAPPRTVWQLSSASAHREVQASALAAARRALTRAANAEHAARRALGDAVRAHEALLALRAEAADAHRAETARVEGNALDDLALIARAARLATAPS